MYLAPLQDWLISAELLAEPVSEEALTAAIEALQEELSREVDGIVDFDLLLDLYARIDDNDWLFYGD